MEKTIHFLNLNNYIDIDPLCEWTLASWEQNKPKDYNIKIWTEEDLLVQEALKRKYCTIAMSQRKWTCLFEYIKAFILYTEGGIFVELDELLIEEIPSDILNLEEFWTFTCPTTSRGPIKLVKNSEVAQKILNYWDFMGNIGVIQLNEEPCLFEADLERLAKQANIVSLPVSHLFDWAFFTRENNLTLLSGNEETPIFTNGAMYTFNLEKIYHLPVVKSFVTNLLLLSKRSTSIVVLNGNYEAFDISEIEDSRWIEIPKYNGEEIHAKN